ncbi:Subtilisin NAT [Colletotrichum truncatum]|uniref:Subtilisin NAT n=1 Tax=Colletotrichum truncatum TaxID=5467 RepID=A0ACC3Z7L6_COLTU|nr:Subtilisin NAT [Colletotrichum truncatum]KAF6782976.1 Subtilisin NAT [Colletotrichum truncatum]
MRFVRLLPALAFVAGVVAQDDGDNNAEVPVELEPKRFIVEFASGTHTKTKRDELSSEEGIKVLKTFESAVFSGASVETDNHNLDTLRDLPDVVGVWPNSKANLVAPVKRQVAVDPEAADEYAVHWATGVDALHEQGILGEGVKIGVVDTGIWYKHSALGGGFGPGFKVAGGRDLVGDTWVAGSTKTPDDDPADQQGHGTHVAGIIAGESASGWRGVAPKATLYAYKVFGPGDGTDTATLIDAFLQAYNDGMDIIHASVGGRGGFANNAWAVVASRIASEGVVVTISAGNSGNGGGYYASSGSSGENVIAVASAEVKRRSTTSADDDGGDVIQPSYFTSWGGLYDLSVKPDIAAPGSNIFSTWVGEDNNQFVLLNGTSMAGPYVAGVAALYISKHGGRTVHCKDFAKNLAMRIISTGSSLPWLLYGGAADPSYRAPSQQVGGGLIDAKKVLEYGTNLKLARFGLNDTANFRPSQRVTIRNDGNEAVRYTFEVENWAGFDMLRSFDARDPGETPRIRYRPEMVPSNFSATASGPGEFSLAPGESREAGFVFQAPQGVNETALPAYGGRVLVKGDNGETVAVPFQGLAFDLKEQMQSAFHGTYPWLRSTSAYSNKTTFNLNTATGAQDFPMLFMKVKWGTREVRWDIYEAGFDNERDWEYPPVQGQKGYIGSATSWSRAGSVSTFNPARHDANDTYAFPVVDQGRNALTTGGFTTTYFWFGKLADGSQIAPGEYTMRFAVLLPFADPAEAGSWKGLTTGFTILPRNGTVSRRARP